MAHYLDFEKPLAEIEGKAEELRAMARQNVEMDVEKEAENLDLKKRLAESQQASSPATGTAAKET